MFITARNPETGQLQAIHLDINAQDEVVITHLDTEMANALASVPTRTGFPLNIASGQIPAPSNRLGADALQRSMQNLAHNSSQMTRIQRNYQQPPQAQHANRTATPAPTNTLRGPSSANQATSRCTFSIPKPLATLIAQDLALAVSLAASSYHLYVNHYVKHLYKFNLATVIVQAAIAGIGLLMFAKMRRDYLDQYDQKRYPALAAIWLGAINGIVTMATSYCRFMYRQESPPGLALSLLQILVATAALYNLRS